METHFRFDGQLHIPLARIERAATYALERGLDAIAFTNYGNTENFDRLRQNKDRDGNPILSSALWDISQRSPSVLELTTEKGHLYILKGEEVVTKQGHLLVWGVTEPIENGVAIDDALSRAYAQGGVAVFSHLLTRLFHGCGVKVFDAMHKKFQGEPLGVEENGQIPDWIGDNKDVRALANSYQVACFGTSDIHGKYLREHEKIGLRKYSCIPRRFIEADNMPEGLKTVMLHHSDKIVVEGDTNTFLETVRWNVESLRVDGRKKLADLWSGLLHSLKK